MSEAIGLTPIQKREPVIPNKVLGMLIFVVVEIMFFAGLISAFVISKASATSGIWPPVGQPRLPVGATAINTTALLISAVFLFMANRNLQQNQRTMKRNLIIVLLLGTFFVGFQGIEWIQLIAQGLTLQSSTYGSFFYLIVGIHALHAVVALGYLFANLYQLSRRRLDHHSFAAAQVFWYFVVFLWPLLYLRVYL